MSLRLITPATSLPFTLEEAKKHLRVTTDDDDAYIEALIGAVTSYVEGPDGFLARVLVNQTWELVLDSFPTLNVVPIDRAIMLPLPPLIEVVSFVYDDASGNELPMPVSDFTVDNISQPGWILPGSAGWPVTFNGINAVRIKYRAGYVDDSSSPSVGKVPGDIKAALLLHLGSLYEHREDIITGTIVSKLPWGAEQLLRQKRIQMSMA